ncbi:LppX_LprAFG lipoprotein [Nocardioides sp. 1609]|uniref:LppX_LprAFG lipoprotein n=1 Tax=Nocardioides sp. 1609 TaxID=2508327 RepID=UPI00142FA130|nr:LppX_LprAFG lipoprotein [Nocardioides sp. 1609]
MKTYRRPATRAAAVAVATALSLSLAACGGDETEAPGSDPDANPSDVLAAAKTRIDETSGVRLELATDATPEGDYLGSAAGVIVADPPAFEGTAAGRFAGLSASDVGVVSVGGVFYANIIGGFTEFDLPECVPDPAGLLDPDTGISSILALATDVQQGDAERGGDNNDEIFTPYTATVPGPAIKNILPCAPGETFDATFTVDDAGELRGIDLTGDFFEGTDELTYTITVEEYDVEQEIAEP